MPVGGSGEQAASQERHHMVDMSTPPLPDGVPEINADPLSLAGRCGGRGR